MRTCRYTTVLFRAILCSPNCSNLVGVHIPQSFVGYQDRKLSQRVGKSESDVNIDITELKRLMESKNLKLIDVRESDEILASGKLPHSVNIPLGDLQEAFELNASEFREKYQIEKPKFDDNLIFTCRSGVRSMRALKLAQDLGYTSALNLQGGYKAWEKAHKKND